MNMFVVLESIVCSYLNHLFVLLTVIRSYGLIIHLETTSNSTIPEEFVSILHCLCDIVYILYSDVYY